MSYDVWLEIDTGGPEMVCVYDWNYTSNCAPMWCKAGADLSEFDHRSAAECEPILSAAIAVMEADPATYEAMNPENEWGSYESVLDSLGALAKAMLLNPKTTVRVSR
jgi:hypothetical protein